MADHAHVLSALDQARGTNLTDTYMRACRDTMRRPLESDDVGRELVELLEERETWQGSMTDLLATLQPPGMTIGWPTTPEALSARIKRLSFELAAAGVAVQRGGNGHGRWITLSRIEGDSGLAKAS